MNNQRKWFLEMESTLRKDAVKIVEQITKNLEHYQNLADKEEAGFKNTTPIFKKICCYDAIKQHCK